VVTVDHTRGNAVALRWLLYDGHGNLVRTMAPDYTLSAFQWRGVWGEVQSSLGTGRGYCANLGHPEDETGLVYMRARYYEPATGRFISEDPARDGVNWYLYADGNPVNKVDYEGKSAEQDVSMFFFTIGTILTGIALANFKQVNVWGYLPTRALPEFHLFRRIAITRVIGPAYLAVAAFSFAAIGLLSSLVIEYVFNAIASYATIIGVLYGTATKVGIRTTAGAAVAAAVWQQTMLLGAIASIGVENE
jgi:RHS repeat-associated protein